MYESLFRTISALAVVLGLMMALAWSVRRFGPGTWAGTGRTPMIRVIATASLGARKSISLVAIGGEVLVVGTGSNEVVDLGRVRDPEQFFKGGSPGKEGGERPGFSLTKAD